MNRIIIYAFLLLVSVTSCLETYEVNVSDYEDLLVVDALITDEVKNHRVYLSRSVPDLDTEPSVETGALVIVTDESGKEEVLTEIEPGVYETDKLQFIAKVGGTYTLSIRTSKGDTYRSDPCTILPKSLIGNVHYKKGKEWNADQTRELPGIHIVVDGIGIDKAYVRWIYDEDWRFRIPYPVRLDYNYSLGDWEYIHIENEYCWKNNISNQIVIHSFANQNNSELKDKEVCFVPSEDTDKLTVRYSVNVKQLSISKQEYEFWNKLQISTENVGDVFGTQPFSITGNIKNVDDDKEPVLGYFQTGSVMAKRLYVDRADVEELNLPIMKYNAGCSIDSFEVDGYAYTSALQIYEDHVANGSYNLHDAIYGDGLSIIGLLLARPVCSDCTKTGTLTKPDFWED